MEVFEDSLKKNKDEAQLEGHPVYTYRQENRELEKRINELENLIKTLKKGENKKTAAQNKDGTVEENPGNEGAANIADYIDSSNDNSKYAEGGIMEDKPIQIPLNEGYLTQAQLDLMLRHLPVDITYVDENSTYRGVIEVSQDITEIQNLEGEHRLLDWD